jgi:hypothetical protein
VFKIDIFAMITSMNEIQNYITQQRQLGIADETIKSTLVAAGHNAEAIAAFFINDNSTPQSTTVTPQKKMHRIWNIAGASFLGGPLAGVYMISQNYRSVGRDREAKDILRNGSIFIAAVIFIAFVIIDIFDFNPFASLSFHWVVVAIYVEMHQKDILAQHKSQNGAFVSLFKTIIIGLTGAVALLTAAFVIGLLYEFTLGNFLG